MFGWLAGGQLLSAGLGSKAAGKAAETQADAARYAADINWDMFDTINQQQSPYRQAGQGALGLINQMFGLSGKAPTAPNRADFTSPDAVRYGVKNPMLPRTTPGAFDQSGYDAAMGQYNTDLESFNQMTPPMSASDPNSFLHRFDANDLNAQLAPNWQFALQQGQGAVQNMANRGGGLVSGNAMRGIADYTIGKSGDLYQQAFQNYTANQTNIFNRLASIAGLGQTANQTTAGSAGTFGTNIGNAAMAAGQAGASGTVGQANALSGALGNIGSWYMIDKFMPRGREGG